MRFIILRLFHNGIRGSILLTNVRVLGLNNILFIQISSTKHVHVRTFIEDVNESILLREFISSCK